MNIKESLEWRYATQEFDAEKTLPEEDLTYLLETINLTATSYGLQPFSVVVVTDQEKKNALVPAAYGQEKVGTNNALLVFCARTDVDEAFITDYVERVKAERSLSDEAVASFRDMMVSDLTNRAPEDRVQWAAKQAYLALGTAMVSAAERHIDAAPMEGFTPADFKDILELDDSLQPVALLALGYRAESDAMQHAPKVRKELDELVKRV